MEIQEFIDFYSDAYENFDLLSPEVLRNHASYLEGFIDGNGKNKRVANIVKDLRDVAHMIFMLKSRA